MLGRVKRVVCGMSGGVDSTVAALLLKKQGYEVIGAFMRNWDITDEVGHCSVDQDFEDAQWVCRKLQIPFHQVKLVKEYWNHVFVNLLDDYENGITPNPDILCNKEIKFGHFYKAVTKEFNAELVSTGHYAQVESCTSGQGKVRLLQAVDKTKDQTFFLSQINQDALRNWIFPNGSLYKSQVKQIAIEHGLEHIASKKESMGICFVGKRNFQNFIDEYLPQKYGKFIDVDSNKVVGQHKGVHHYTLGQRCRIGGLDRSYYVAHKVVDTQDIFVASGHDHPIFYSRNMETDRPFWIREQPQELSNQEYKCLFRFQNKMPLMQAIIKLNSSGGLDVQAEKALRSATPGQYAVFYSGLECLGSARIVSSSPLI